MNNDTPQQNLVQLIVSIGSEALPLERFAANELHHYLSLLTNERLNYVTITSDTTILQAQKVFVLGTASTHPFIGSLGQEYTAHTLGSEGFRLRTIRQNDQIWIIIAGGGDRGVLYGVYALLEQLGCSFHLYGDILPNRLQALPELDLDIQSSPRFKLRGTQLWCYWYPGRDSWGWEEYKRYIDQLPKMGLNFFDFPLYFYEPLYTDYVFQGHRPEGYRLSGFSTDLLRIGREHFTGNDRFTSPDIPNDGSQADRNRASIRLMRRVFTYARSHGIKTGVGIELSNSLNFGCDILQSLPESDRYEQGQLICPSSPSAEALARARLEALVDAYPDCDTYTIWQPEIGVFRDTTGSPYPDDIAFREQHKKYTDILTGGDFDYLQWLLLAYRILKEIKPDAVIATGGWGAERIMAAADEILPSDIIRSTIAYYEPQNTLNQSRLTGYEKTTGPKWHITWSETDQHLWVIQPKTSSTAKVLIGLEERGVSGVALLQWRNLFNDLDISFFAQACWDPFLDPQDFWRKWSSQKYGAEVAEPVSKAIAALEAFNYFICDIGRNDILGSEWWVGYDCFISSMLNAHYYLYSLETFDSAWFENTVQPHFEFDPQAIEFLEEAQQALTQAQSRLQGQAQIERLAYFANRVSYTLALFRSHLTIAMAVKLFRDGIHALTDNDEQGFNKVVEDTLQCIRDAEPEQIVKLFAQRLGEREREHEPGELGMLINLNQKFLGSVRQMEARLLRLLGRYPIDSEQTRSPVFKVNCSMKVPMPSWQSTKTGNAVAWSQETDIVLSTESGFGYQLGGSTLAKRLTPDVGCWSSQDQMIVTITTPGSFSGRLRLYLYEELEWNSLFRWQVIRVNGQDIGEYMDFFCRGEYWDQGIWVEVCIASEPEKDTRDIMVEIVRSGNADVMLSGIELIMP